MNTHLYLYGAAVQGIQDFIFSTNKLKEIVGASELVNQICTTAFEDLLVDYKSRKASENQDYDYEILVKAAGNIKCYFSSKDALAKVVREFPRKVIEMAPGITVSQAVVEATGDFSSQVDELEAKLRTQRNMPKIPTTMGYMGIERNQRSGYPNTTRKASLKYKSGSKEYVDLMTFSKLVVQKDAKSNLTLRAVGSNSEEVSWHHDLEQMTSEKNNWLAIIHADGNGLGQLLSQIGHDSNLLKSFSTELDQSTQKAAQRAFKDIENQFPNEDFLPLRPVVLGGDDLSLICRADLAMPFMTNFLRYFEEETARMSVILENFSLHQMTKLTACAGIAYVKSSFPFHFGYQLAEQLCGQAKAEAKKKTDRQADAPSCLMFHKVQDSLVSSYSDIIKRELTINENPIWQYGPYYLHREFGSTLETLTHDLKKISSPSFSKVRSHLRQWMTLRSQVAGDLQAQLKLERVVTLMKSDTCRSEEKSKIEEWTFSSDRSPVYDLLSLYAVSNKQVKH